MIQSINLLNALPKREKAKLPAKLIIKIWLAILVILLLFYGYNFWQKSQLAKQLKQVRAQESGFANQIMALSKQLPNATELKSKKDIAMHLAREVEAKAQIVAILKQKKNINTKGFSVYLESLSKKIPNQVWLTDIVLSNGAKHVALEGKASSADAVFNFMSALDESPEFKGAQLKLASLTSPKEESEADDAVKTSTDSKPVEPVKFTLESSDA